MDYAIAVAPHGQGEVLRGRGEVTQCIGWSSRLKEARAAGADHECDSVELWESREVLVLVLVLVLVVVVVVVGR
jgi:hypothetical protein